MQRSPVQWIPTPASLFNHPHESPSLSNTTRVQQENAQAPNFRHLSEGRSVHHPRSHTTTPQLQRREKEAVAALHHASNINYLQRLHVFDLTHRKLLEGTTSDPPLSQPPTVLQIELTSTHPTHEAIRAHQHTHQLLQPSQPQYSHMPKAPVSNDNRSEKRHHTQIQYAPLLSIAAGIANYPLLNVVVKRLHFRTHHNSRLQLPVIQPLAPVHHISLSVILNTAAPSGPITPASFILNLGYITVVMDSIAHIQFPNPKALIHLLVISVVQYTPTTRFVLQYSTFPTISFTTQIYNLIVLSST